MRPSPSFAPQPLQSETNKGARKKKKKNCIRIRVGQDGGSGSDPRPLRNAPDVLITSLARDPSPSCAEPATQLFLTNFVEKPNYINISVC